jgi:hypothetical protein
MDTELQAENKSAIKMMDAIDSFKGKLKLWKTQLMKGVLTQFVSVHSRLHCTFDTSVYSLCIHNVLKKF